MPVDPGPLRQLLKLLHKLFLRIFHWIFSKKSQPEADIEARIDLPANIIYGERLPTWMTEPTKKETDNSQPLRHSDEWAKQKAAFLRSPSLKRKSVQDDTLDKNARVSGPRVRFSDFPVEYPRTPSDAYSQDLSLPPTIRIEDWSTPPSPGTPPISISDSLTVITASLPHSGLVSSSSRDSLTVPSAASLGSNRGSRTSGNRKTVVIGTGNKRKQPRFNYSLEQNHLQKSHEEVRRSGLTKSSKLLERNSELDGSTLPRLVLPTPTAKPLSSSSILDLLQISSIFANEADSTVLRPVQVAEIPEGAIRRNNTKKSLTGSQGHMSTRVFQHLQRKSTKLRSVPKRHHSQPLTTTRKFAPLWNGIGIAPPFPSEMGKDGIDGGKDYYRHSIDVVGLPFSMGITLSSDVQTAILTRFHEKGLAATPEKCSSGFQRRLSRPSGKAHQPSTSLSSDVADVPYPYVFDLDDYFQDSSPPSVPVTPTFLKTTSEASSSHNARHDSYDTPTPAPRNSSSSNLPASSCTSELRQARNPGAVSPEPFMHKTATPVQKHFTWSSDTDEDVLSLSRSEYSDDSDTPQAEPNSSGDLPLAHLISQRSKSQSKPSKRKGIYVTERTGTALISPDRNSLLSDSAQHAKIAAGKNEHAEMEQIRASLRSHYIFTQRQRDPLNEDNVGDDNEDNMISLVESYSSGSTLSHHYHPHQWNARSLSSPLHGRRLDPVIEATSESECSSGSCTPKAALSPRLDQDSSDIVTVHRTPTPAWVLPPRRSGRAVDLVSVRLGLGSRGQPKSAKENDRYCGTALSNEASTE
ncbi:hypothetical protein D9756_003008 [Leucocoprinus leucothites]|uniref:Uncharacterized protein n=1 Tax=Leucocoprinus leucothites TaxID=201217 RepID=A0A8H5G7J2_9AGAR|nr:hypothetical protein D9756_003008 [Leucoagaricus leucothites]